MISHVNVIANVLQFRVFEEVGRRKFGVETQTTIGVLPLSHIYGLVITAIVGQYRGDQTVILPKYDLTLFLETIQKYKVNQLYVVPPMLVQMIGNKDLCSKHDLSSIRVVFSGAAPLGVEVVHRIRKMYPHWHIGQGYGESAHPSLTIPTWYANRFSDYKCST